MSRIPSDSRRVGAEGLACLPGDGPRLHRGSVNADNVERRKTPLIVAANHQ